MSDLQSEIQKLSPSARVELFEVDLTALGDDVYRFHAGTNSLSLPVVWQGQTYNPWPVEASGFDYNTSGQIPRPKIVLANTSGTITALVLALNDCLGGKVTRKVTMAKFLDAVNFPGGVNPTADPNAQFDDEVYYIDRKATENKNVVEFELTAAFDVTGVKLPRRQIIQNLCPWRYRGAECGYTGAPIAAKDDTELQLVDAVTPQEIAVINTRDAYRASLATVKQKLDALSVANTNLNVASEYVLLETQYNRIFYPFDPPAVGAYFVDEAASDRFVWNGVTITNPAGVYRKGEFVESQGNGEGVTAKLYRIQRWGVDAAALAAATSAKNTAQTEYNNAISARDAALTAYNNAVAALPSNSPIYAKDVCGKRVNSCKMRFGETGELPFGGFPGAGRVG